jgi:hypothetical protein
VEHFQPVSVRRAAVAYLDQVEVPILPGADGIPFDEYFRLGANFPDQPFGPMGYFSLQLFFPRRDSKDQLQVLFHTAPAVPGSGVCRFQMHWHCLCEDVRSLDKNEIIERLEAARLRLRECFRASFTDKGWALFQPKDSA